MTPDEFADELDSNTVAFIRALPKAELHVHLEGSIRPATLLRLARRHQIDLPASDEAGLRRFYQFRDFNHFIEVYIIINQSLCSSEDFELITREYAAEAAAQNIRYIELTFTPYPHVRRKGLGWDEIIGGIAAGCTQARREWGIEIRLIPDIARNCYSHGAMEEAEKTAEWAVAAQDLAVVALGLGGEAVGNPPEAFASVYAYARERGLHSVPHAGEWAGPESIWGVLHALHAERIGHGVQCVRDAALVNYLREQQIPLEICPTSNVCTGAVSSLEIHPVRSLYDAGVYITLSSDGPPMFNTNLTNEYMLLASQFHFTRSELAALSLNSVRAAFLPEEQRKQLDTQFQTEIDTLLDSPSLA